MSNKIKLSKCLLSRIEQNKANADGLLFGLVHSNELVVLGFSLNRSIENNLPTGVKECGHIRWGPTFLADSIETSKTSHQICISYDFKSVQPLTIFTKSASNEWSEEKAYETVTEEDLWNNWIVLRTTFGLNFSNNSNDAINYKHFMLKVLTNVEKAITSTHTPMFEVDKTDIVLEDNKTINGVGKNTKVLNLLNEVAKSQGEVKTKKKDGNSVPTHYSCINFNTLFNWSSDKEEDDTFYAIFAKNSEEITGIQFNALALVHNNKTVEQIYDILLETITKNIKLIESAVTNEHRNLETFVFYPKDICHFISFVYPQQATDDDEEQLTQRKQNHVDLNLPRPCLRRFDAYEFDEKEEGNYPINPHVGLKNTVNGGKQYLVKGKYSYHHYMQDNFNDDGWGCAYRSFQTLFSWYRLQGYTTKAIPTHQEIQQCLVDLEDKPKSFVGSRQWIGSTEVSMCLQYFLDVDSRIVHVNSGAELAQHGPTLAQHFLTYGTPVMIGGGVLAHTILGVDFNSETNDLKFLILDPHYTGADDLDIIQKKGWCGWKSTSFWDKKSYYNFCMPMFPNAVEY